MTAQKWVLATLAGAAALVISADGAKAQGLKPGGTVAAVVNGEVISIAEIDAVLKSVPPSPTPATEIQQRQLRADALDLLIDDLLIRQFLSAHAPKASQAEYDKEFAALQTSLKAKNMSLPDFLRETSQTEEHLRMEIIKKIQWERYIQEHVTEAALKKYYEENRDFYDRVTVQASHILFRLSPSAREEDRSQARNRLRELRQKIVGNQIDFAEAARKYSQCQSAAKGGDIGFFPRKWAVDENIAKAAFALPVGQVSDVVQTDYGLHLVKVTARKPGKP